MSQAEFLSLCVNVGVGDLGVAPAWFQSFLWIMSALLVNWDLVLEAVHLVEENLWMMAASFLSLDLVVGDPCMEQPAWSLSLSEADLGHGRNASSWDIGRGTNFLILG